jgi:hypothetical protein
MVTLTTWGRGVLLTNSRANVWDTFLPTLMGIAEFCLFAVLAPRENRDAQGKDNGVDNKLGAWNFWYLVLGIHAMLAAFLVRNRIANTDVERDFVPQLKDLAKEYMGWMVDDKKGATTGMILFSIIGVLMIAAMVLIARKWKTKKLAYTIYGIPYLLLAILPIIIYWGVINDAERQRQRTDEVISGLRENPPISSIKQR